MRWDVRLSLILITAVIAPCMPGCAPARCGQQPGDRLLRCGDEIVAAGQFFHTGTPVVLWMDPGGYDAYRCRRHFEPELIMPHLPAAPTDPNRYGTRRNLPKDLQVGVTERGWNLDGARRVVDQFVIHYDVCGTSARCFKVLHDLRGLSVHFLLDIDGTVYQTLDLKERAWHAGTANDRSVGIEIANIGAYHDMKVLDQWYASDLFGWPYISIPDTIKERNIRTPWFVGRPARKEVIVGTINGQDLMQYDFTNEQYEALGRLTAALSCVFPKLRLAVPRNSDGEVRMDVLSDKERAEWSGLMGHWHVTKEKVDPGPAFDWDRVIDSARRERGMCRR
jgi:N-acetylmuramoyl-L-alanine amidase